MAGETPDYARWNAQSTVYPVTDLGEMAARLGSIVTYDRRGDVLFLDDFEAGLARWQAETSGAGATVDLSLATARSGLFSARLVGGKDTSRYARIYHEAPYSVMSSLGFEMALASASNGGEGEWELDVYTGAAWRDAVVRWDWNAGTLKYQDSSGVFQQFATNVGRLADLGLFVPGKLVIRAELNEYHRFLLFDQEYDLSGIAIRAAASSSQPYLRARAGVYSRAAQNDTIHVDDVILTQNEPL